MLADTFGGKQVLPEVVPNAYTALSAKPAPAFVTPVCSAEQAAGQLRKLRVGCATGPDLVPVAVLRQCADALGPHVAALVNRILARREWPATWLRHWVVPLHKRGSRFDRNQYRGIHLSSQLSKVVERLLLELLAPWFPQPEAWFGPRQFAYTKGQGARDALLLVVLSWLRAFNDRKKVSLYCGDVSGAFDRVCSKRLVAKLAAHGVPQDIVELFCSWLRERFMSVVVDGEESELQRLIDMVFQGTVWGPTLWNVFFADAREAIANAHFEEVVFADDLNAWRVFDRSVPDELLISAGKDCQAELHRWGEANQVTFEPTKEIVTVLSTTAPSQWSFRLLGVPFDCRLCMRDAVEEVVCGASRRAKGLLRCRRYYGVPDMVLLYKKPKCCRTWSTGHRRSTMRQTGTWTDSTQFKRGTFPSWA